MTLIGTSKLLSLAKGLCNYSPDTFPLLRVGSGDETNLNFGHRQDRRECYIPIQLAVALLLVTVELHL